MKAADQQTRPSLLLRLRNALDAAAWEQFVEVYTPLIFGFCRHRGLPEPDAADVTQEVMRAVAQAIGRFDYDPQRGKFRAWLLTITRNELWSFLARRQREARGDGEAAMRQWLETSSAPEMQAAWDLAYRRRLFAVAAQRVHMEVRETTWQAFWRMTWEEQDGKVVARSLGLSVGAVYIAKSRVLARLREHLRRIEEDDRGDAAVPL